MTNFERVTGSSNASPLGAASVPGIEHVASPHSVAETVSALTEAIAAARAKLFAVIDHSGEAEQAGLALRDTKLMIFGNPVAGTPVMQAAPLAALDLPLKILVWADDAGTVWMTYLSAAWLAGRHELGDDLSIPLAAPEKLANKVAGT